MGYCRCRSCSQTFIYSWLDGGSEPHPKTCVNCGKEAAVQIEKLNLTPDDIVTIYNKIEEIESQK